MLVRLKFGLSILERLLKTSLTSVYISISLDLVASSFHTNIRRGCRQEVADKVGAAQEYYVLLSLRGHQLSCQFWNVPPILPTFITDLLTFISIDLRI